MLPNDDMKRPLLETYFGKNKISSFKGTMYIKAYPDKAYFEEVSKITWDAYVSANSMLDRDDPPLNTYELE
jgi:hypothetical protein